MRVHPDNTCLRLLRILFQSYPDPEQLEQLERATPQEYTGRDIWCHAEAASVDDLPELVAHLLDATIPAFWGRAILKDEHGTMIHAWEDVVPALIAFELPADARSFTSRSVRSAIPSHLIAWGALNAMQASISRPAAGTFLKQPSQSAGYLLLVVITIVMSILPLVLVSLHPQTIPVFDSQLDRTAQQEVRPLVTAQIGLAERWCITPGHIPHPVPTPTLSLWMALSLALIGFCVIQMCIHLRRSAEQRMLQTHGTPSTPPPRTLLFLS